MKSWTTKNGQKIYQVLGRRCNSFLISYQNRHLLVDTGLKNKWKYLSKELDNLGVSHNSLKALILTHSHVDHAANAASIKEKYKTAIIVHKSEADYLKRGKNPVIHGTIFITKFLSYIIPPKLVLRYLRHKPADYDILVDKRYDLKKLGFNGYIIHTPGHTQGSVCVIIDDEIAIVGDNMFGVFRRAVFPPFADDPKLMVKSWKKLLDTGCSIYLPAHGTGRSRELVQQKYNKYKKVYDL
ncbi:MAG: MBL fold metallo-hydrolase [Pseudomonadota bacterium]